MLDAKPLNRIIFLDIETTSQYENFKDLTDRKKEIFKRRFKKDISSEIDRRLAIHKVAESLAPKPEEVPATAGKKKAKKLIASTAPEELAKKIELEACEETYNIKAPILPEFGRILCISMGVIWEEGGIYKMKITSFYDKDEKKLLLDMVNHPKLGPILNAVQGKYEKNPNNFWALCGHNSKIFDFPFIARRLIINEIKLPAIFDYSHLKPWEVDSFLLCTKTVWGYGVFDSSTSLECLADLFGIESSKDDIDGSEVKDVYYKEGDLERIKIYCEKDVKCLAEICLKMKCMPHKIELVVPDVPKETKPSEEVELTKES